MIRRDFHDIIRRPIVSEKSTNLAEQRQMIFETPLDAKKPLIKKAVEEIFKVKVLSVNTLRQKGKVKRMRGQEGRRKSIKKAIVTLAEGEKVDLASGAKN